MMVNGLPSESDVGCREPFRVAKLFERSRCLRRLACRKSGVGVAGEVRVERGAMSCYNGQEPLSQ